ncbi:MAG: TetR/AcrR family transcriptional regulator [Actinomycetota bacterium]
MEAGNATEVRPGLRERKKQKTRETIIEIALELFAERGYEETTIAEIADVAEVSPRTIFAYFPSKEDILFCDTPEIQERLAQVLRDRPEGATALDALRDFIAGSLSPDSNEARNEALRRRIVAGNETLRRNGRARLAGFEQLMAEAIAVDLHAGPGDIRPRMVAAALVAAFSAIQDHDPAAPPESSSPEQAMAVIDDVMGFLRGGLEALRHD